MTTKERKGVRGARLTMQGGLRLLKAVETGRKNGAEADVAVAKARLMLKDGLALLDEEVEVPAEAAKEAKAEIKAKEEKKESVLDRVMPRAKNAPRKKAAPKAAKKTAKKAAAKA